MSDAPVALHVVSSNALAGIERHVLALIGALRAHGSDARLACRANADVLREAALDLELPTLDWRELARSRAGVIHAHDGRAALAGAAVAHHGDALVRTQHFIAPASSGRRGVSGGLSLSAHRFINRRYRGQVMVSDAVLAAAQQRGELGTARVAVIPAGIELPTEVSTSEAQAWRGEHRDPVLISAGRMQPERHFEVLIRAMPQVLARFPACRLVLAGDGSEREDLRALAAEIGVAAAIDWPGWVTDLGAVLGRGHVYVNTWPLEAFGMATAEAMSYGLVPVVSDSGAAGELIEPGLSGLQFAADDSAALARVVGELLADPKRRAQLGSGAAVRAQRYGMDGVAEEMLGFYRAVTG
jgi:glycosyltransferase involved in cell wall biosynthesis